MAHTSRPDDYADEDDEAQSQTSHLERQLRRQLLLNHRLDQEHRNLELRLEEAQNQLAAYGDAPDARELEDRLAKTEHELVAEQAGRLQVIEQLAEALEQLREQGGTILSLTASLDRAAKQLADADACLDFAWPVQSGETCPIAESGLARLACHDATRPDDYADEDDEAQSQTSHLERQLRRQLLLNHRLDQEHRNLGLQLEEAQNQLVVTRERGGAIGADAASGRADAPDARALEERLAKTEHELAEEQAARLHVDQECQQLEGQLAVARRELTAAQANADRAETAAFALSRKLAGALRTQNNSAKLIARLRKS